MKIERTLLCVFFCFWFLELSCQLLQDEKKFDNQIRMNYMKISMPSIVSKFKEPEMGLGGLHYQLPLNQYFYISGGMYCALHGDQGGLFTLGVALGLNKKLYKNIYIDGNIHLGGGGGFRWLINDGSYINSNIGLEYKKSDYSFGVQYSYFDFVSGHVRDNTLSVYLQIPSKIYAKSYREANRLLTPEQMSDLFNKKVSKSALVVRSDVFKPRGKSKTDVGTKLTNNLNLIGFEYQKYASRNAFLYIHTDAIYKGLRAGFMDLFIGAGYHLFLSEYLDFTSKFSVGSAGGRIYPEGGLTAYPSLGVDFKFLENITLATHIGYFKALDGDLEARTYGFGVKYMVSSGGKTFFDDDSKVYNSFYAQGFRVSIENQTYLDVPKTDDLFDKLNADLQLLGVNLAYDFTKDLYGFGEAGFAYKERSGGYAHGLIGVGFNTSRVFKSRGAAYIDLAAGVAGGGGIDTKQGLVFRPTLGVYYDLNNFLSLKASYGRFLSYYRTLNVSNFNIGLSYNLSFIKAM